MSLVDSTKSGIHIGRDDLVTLTAIVMITVISLLFPYVVVSSHIRVTMLFAPYPYDPGIPVYLLSVLADDSPYHDYSAIAAVVHTYGFVFIMLTQAMVILHMCVGSGRTRSIVGLLLSLVLSAIWIYLCQVIYGSPLQYPVSNQEIPIIIFPTTYLVQYPFVPLVSSLFMLAYRRKLQAKQ